VTDHLPDYLTADDLRSLGLDGRTIARLVRDAYHVGLDGGPCWAADRLADLLGLDGEGRQ
jgi:hypothetical protein